MAVPVKSRFLENKMKEEKGTSLQHRRH